ncbi:MAG: hypothetical protein NXI15_15275 [Gammaproteobacteria bacterium]|jgi:uncharacterized membrane protein|nr:hypothetical protein [Gammaproteobacteria bacterium]
MTQHILETDTAADKAAMRQLGLIISGFFVCTALLALGVALVAG